MITQAISLRECMKDYHQQLFTEFELLFAEAKEKIQVDTIHDLRVNMKKQKAFISMLNATIEDFDTEPITIELRKLFKKAGKLRDKEIKQKILAAFESKKRKIKNDDLSKLFGEFSRMAKKYRLDKLRNLNFKVHESISPKQGCIIGLHRYFKAILKKITTEIHQSAKKEKALHNLRIKFKELFYNYWWLHDCNEDRAFPTGIFSQLDQFQNLLGDWHDLDILLADKKQSDNCTPPQWKAMKKRKKKLHKEIIKALPEIESLLKKKVRKDILQLLFSKVLKENGH